MKQLTREIVAACDIYDHEVPGDPVFDAIVRERTEQANGWLAEEGAQ